MNKPIMQFKDDKELRDTMLWWKDKLYLGDWIISIKLMDEVLNEGDDDNLYCGLNRSDFNSKLSVIEISTEFRKDKEIFTYCEERTVVHELLHCVFPALSNDEILTENIVEFMARSLIETKYNLDKSFWDNSRNKEVK